MVGRYKKPEGPAQPPQRPEPPAQAPMAPDSPHVQTPPVEVPQAPKDDSLYSKDRAERLAFEKADQKMLTGTVQRIKLGRVCTIDSPQLGHVETAPPVESDCEHEAGFVIGWGKRPQLARGHLRLAAANGEDTGGKGGDLVWSQLPAAVEELQKHSLPLESGPYADKDGVIEHFAQTIFEGVNPKDVRKLIGRVMDSRPMFEMDPDYSELLLNQLSYANSVPRRFTSAYSFVFNESFGGLVPPDELPTAGAMLSMPRARENPTHGGTELGLTHPLDYYLLAVAALRHLGHQAYPALAVAPAPSGKGELIAPVIAVLDMVKDTVPLTTFNAAMVAHPPVGAFDILSDEAMLGVVHAMHAENRVRQLIDYMDEQAAAGKRFEELTISSIDNKLVAIARSLFESMKRWDGKPVPGISSNPFVGKALGMLNTLAENTVLQLDLDAHRRAGAPPEVLSDLEGAVASLRSSGVDPVPENLFPHMVSHGISPESPQGKIIMAAADIVLDAYKTSNSFVEKVQTLLGVWIQAAKEGK